jgi:hypothetical protein
MSAITAKKLFMITAVFALLTYCGVQHTIFKVLMNNNPFICCIFSFTAAANLCRQSRYPDSTQKNLRIPEERKN